MADKNSSMIAGWVYLKIGSSWSLVFASVDKTGFLFYDDDDAAVENQQLTHPAVDLTPYSVSLGRYIEKIAAAEASAVPDASLPSDRFYLTAPLNTSSPLIEFRALPKMPRKLWLQALVAAHVRGAEAALSLETSRQQQKNDPIILPGNTTSASYDATAATVVPPALPSTTPEETSKIVEEVANSIEVLQRAISAGSAAAEVSSAAIATLLSTAASNIAKTNFPAPSPFPYPKASSSSNVPPPVTTATSTATASTTTTTTTTTTIATPPPVISSVPTPPPATIVVHAPPPSPQPHARKSASLLEEVPHNSVETPSSLPHPKMESSTPRPPAEIRESSVVVVPKKRGGGCCS